MKNIIKKIYQNKARRNKKCDRKTKIKEISTVLDPPNVSVKGALEKMHSCLQLGMVTHTWSPNPWEAEAGES